MESERSTDAFRTLEARALDLERLQRDALTGLHSRAWFEDKLAQRLSEKRDFRTPLSLMLADIDRLGAINQAHGQGAGDEVIVGVGTFLRGSLRQRDLVARHSGAAFAILLSQGPAAAGPLVAERLRAALADQWSEAAETKAPEREIRVTLSVGCVTIDRGSSVTHDQVLEAAARALAAAKRDGRDRVVSLVGTRGESLDSSLPAV